MRSSCEASDGALPRQPHGEHAALVELARARHFFRDDPVRSARHAGAGLGLAIVKGIVEAHGGSVRELSEAQDPHRR